MSVPVLPEEEHYGCEFCGVDFTDLAEMEDHVCPNEPDELAQHETAEDDDD